MKYEFIEIEYIDIITSFLLLSYFPNYPIPPISLISNFSIYSLNTNTQQEQTLLLT